MIPILVLALLVIICLHEVTGGDGLDWRHVAKDKESDPIALTLGVSCVVLVILVFLIGALSFIL